MPPELGHAPEQLLHAVSKLTEPGDPVHAALCHADGCSRATRVVRGRRSLPVARSRSACYLDAMARWIGVAVAVLAAIALVIALGEGEDRSDRSGSAPSPPPTLLPAPPGTGVEKPGSSTTTAPPAAPEPASAVRPLETPDDARRILDDAGIDEEELSAEVGEHMERRFEER